MVQAGNNHKANLVQINANRAHELIQGVRRQAHQVGRLPQPDDCASVQYSQQQVTPPSLFFGNYSCKGRDTRTA